MSEGGGDKKSGVQTFANPISNTGRARDKAAEQFGISGEQARKTLYVADNADLLDPADFADWDEGRLSTNLAAHPLKTADWSQFYADWPWVAGVMYHA